MLMGKKRGDWERFLVSASLKPDTDTDQTVTVWDDDEIIASGSRKGNLLKCIAVDPARQGEGLTATVLTELKQEAFRENKDNLFLYTKPRNRRMFEPLFFYPVAQTDQVLLMESTRNGIDRFLKKLEENPKKEGKIGCIVMNADPFTRGHQYLAETAACQCDRLYIFVLSEDKGTFSAEERMDLVKAGTAHLENVKVYPTGEYLISSATFPKYFLKDQETAQREHYLLDLAVFTQRFVPHFGITHRFAGTEPTCAVTGGYNRAMAEILPQHQVEFVEIPRRQAHNAAISASTVRREMGNGNLEALKQLVPETTYRLIEKKIHR
jgi:[citrate (pro-3S)-lyase] ligase